MRSVIERFLDLSSLKIYIEYLYYLQFGSSGNSLDRPHSATGTVFGLFFLK